MALMIRALRSVQTSSFLKPRVCQALVHSTTQRAGLERFALGAVHPFAPEFGGRGAGLAAVVAGVQVHGGPLWQVEAEA